MPRRRPLKRLVDNADRAIDHANELIAFAKTDTQKITAAICGLSADMRVLAAELAADLAELLEECQDKITIGAEFSLHGKTYTVPLRLTFHIKEPDDTPTQQ